MRIRTLKTTELKQKALWLALCAFDRLFERIGRSGAILQPSAVPRLCLIVEPVAVKPADRRAAQHDELLQRVRYGAEGTLLLCLSPRRCSQPRCRRGDGGSAATNGYRVAHMRSLSRPCTAEGELVK